MWRNNIILCSVTPLVNNDIKNNIKRQNTIVFMVLIYFIIFQFNGALLQDYVAEWQHSFKQAIRIPKRRPGTIPEVAFCGRVFLLKNLNDHGHETLVGRFGSVTQNTMNVADWKIYYWMLFSVRQSKKSY